MPSMLRELAVNTLVAAVRQTFRVIVIVVCTNCATLYLADVCVCTRVCTHVCRSVCVCVFVECCLCAMLRVVLCECNIPTPIGFCRSTKHT